MKKLLYTFSFFAIAGSASVASAEIFPPTHFRCAADQLFGHPSEGNSPGRTGDGRTQWARKAFGFYSFGPGNSVPNARRFWLSSFDTDVDEAALNSDTDLYPVYYNNFADALWVGPGPANATWHGTTRVEIGTLGFTGALNLPTGVEVDALCEAGCYMPDQQLRVGDSSVAMVAAQESGQRSVTTLAPGATIDAISLMQNTIARWTVDIAPANQTIITLKMKSGGTLRVTTEHPLVTSDGMMKQAQHLIVGDALVRDNGAADAVVSITKADEYTKVYNLRPTTTDLTSNVLVAQGYLSGSARYQSEYVKYLNRVLFREKIPSNVISRRAVTAKN